MLLSLISSLSINVTLWKKVSAQVSLFIFVRTLKYDFQLSRLRDIANKPFSMIGRSVLEDVHDVTAGFELR